MKPETAAIHVGRSIDPAHRAVMQSIVPSTTFAYDPHDENQGMVYSRYSNPNRNALEECVAQMEGGTGSAAFASGMAAAMAILHTMLKSGDHVLMPQDCYFSMRALASELYAHWGLEVSFADMANADALRAAFRPNTRLVWTETPSNPQLRLTDLAAVSALAHERGALCSCDNTWATPLLQSPLALGCDLVFHSSTKYFGGHSDLMGGIVVARQPALLEKIQRYQKIGGAVPSPHDSWLTLRSLATLPQRMKAHCENAMQVAQFLASHPNVEKVHYPGLPENEFHALAVKQMRGFGGMVSIEVRGNERETAREVAMRVGASTKLFTHATSLGGVESLLEHRASVEGPTSLTPPSLLRLSVGLEHPDDLIADLAQALG